MRRLKIIGVALLVVGLVTGLALFLLGFFRPKKAGIYIETTPAATVLIDGEQVGRTPYDGTRSAGEVVIKLIPDSFETPLAPFETKVNLTAGIKTIVKRKFGQTDDAGSGVIVSFEKAGGGEVGLSVVSIPDAAQVTLDGQSRGFTPYKTSSITAAEHQLSVSAKGFLEETLGVRTYSGYKLIAVYKLAPGESRVEGIAATPAPSPTPEPLSKIKVEILTTPTGFLRVREEPNKAAAIVGEVKPGEKYDLLDESPSTGTGPASWYRIQYKTDSEGWVSAEYAKKLTGITPIPAPKR